MIIGSGQML